MLLDLKWHHRYYEEGDPKCLCARCGEPIPDVTPDGEDYIAPRLFTPDGKHCAPLHDECFAKLLKSSALARGNTPASTVH